MAFTRFEFRVALPLLVGLLLVTCISGAPAQTAADKSVARDPNTAEHVLRPVPSPDLTGIDSAVQAQIREAQSRAATALQDSLDLSQAYGKLGEIYQAYGLNDPAIACYSNAHVLAPNEFKWPYYLGYLFQTQGDMQQATTYYEIAWRLAPDDELVVLRLAETDLRLNRLDDAERLYLQVRARNRQNVTALDGLGKVALAQHEFAKAVEYLIQALAIDPQAAYLHYPLAMAYRGLGKVEKAEAELAKHGPASPTLVDPYVTELQELKTGTANLWTRGSQQMAAGDLPGAIGTYRKLVEVNESDPVAKTYLGTALARAGNTEEAIQQFNEALKKAPTNTETNYCLGVVLAELGKDNEAIAHFQATIKGDSQFTEAHFQLANVLMRTRNYTEAEAEYSKTVEQDPKNAFASLMEAMALVRLSRYVDARSALERSHKTLPQDPDIANALARLLAASPDNNVRDGKRALEIMQELLKNDGSADTEQAETIAMALAETGQFEKAAGVQRSVILTAEQDSPSPQIETLHETLALYEHGQACRVPWHYDDPIFVPTPQKAVPPDMQPDHSVDTR
jgi:tetratricopeptide (TPR) repeat protein